MIGDFALPKLTAYEKKFILSVAQTKKKQVFLMLSLR